MLWERFLDQTLDTMGYWGKSLDYTRTASEGALPMYGEVVLVWAGLLIGVVKGLNETCMEQLLYFQQLLEN